MKSYGITEQRQTGDKLDLHYENVKIKGYSIETKLFDAASCDEFVQRLEKIYRQQESDFGSDNLRDINDSDIARMPFINDKSFFGLFTQEMVLALTERVLGKRFHLHLQNGVINRPAKEHHQSSWHRDLPYQDWVISRPLGFNAFICLTDFTDTNGATFFLPYSHRLEYFPSTQFVEENQLQITAPKGSVIFFDSMMYHRAGYNSTKETRVGINTMFVVPIIKQQVDIPANFDRSEVNDLQAELLGMNFQVPKDVKDLRTRKMKKK